MPYFIIRNSDGDTTVTEGNKDDVQLLAEDGYEFIDELNEINGERWSSDTNYWGDKVLVIKGDIVVPEAITVVTRYEIP